MRNTLFITLVLAVLSLAASALAAPRVPNFKLEGVDGKTYELKEIAKVNKLIMIEFWEVNCKPCRKLMPHLQRLYEVYKPAGFQLIVISRDTTLTMAKVKPLVTAKKWTFPVLYDPSQAVSQAYQVKFSPVTFLINNKGEILTQHSGFKPGDERKYEQAIIAALELTDEDVAKLYEQAERNPPGESSETVETDEDAETAESEETAPESDNESSPPAEDIPPLPAGEGK